MFLWKLLVEVLDIVTIYIFILFATNICLNRQRKTVSFEEEYDASIQTVIQNDKTLVVESVLEKLSLFEFHVERTNLSIYSSQFNFNSIFI